MDFALPLGPGGRVKVKVKVESLHSTALHPSPTSRKPAEPKACTKLGIRLHCERCVLSGAQCLMCGFSSALRSTPASRCSSHWPGSPTLRRGAVRCRRPGRRRRPLLSARSHRGRPVKEPLDAIRFARSEVKVSKHLRLNRLHGGASGHNPKLTSWRPPALEFNGRTDKNKPPSWPLSLLRTLPCVAQEFSCSECGEELAHQRTICVRGIRSLCGIRICVRHARSPRNAGVPSNG